VLHRTVPHGEVALFLQALDIFVLPTVAITPRLSTLELDAHALQEAMACGVACIGSESGPIPEILQGAGILVPPSRRRSWLRRWRRCSIRRRGNPGEKRADAAYWSATPTSASSRNNC
jgi:glycosyltransferase involved in cell wall biosynthesis